MNFTAPAAIHRAEREMEQVLAACIDYRRTLIQMRIPDPVSGRVEQIYEKYGIALEPRSLYGERP